MAQQQNKMHLERERIKQQQMLQPPKDADMPMEQEMPSVLAHTEAESKPDPVVIQDGVDNLQSPNGTDLNRQPFRTSGR